MYSYYFYFEFCLWSKALTNIAVNHKLLPVIADLINQEHLINPQVIQRAHQNMRNELNRD